MFDHDARRVGLTAIANLRRQAALAMPLEGQNAPRPSWRGDDSS